VGAAAAASGKMGMAGVDAAGATIDGTTTAAGPGREVAAATAAAAVTAAAAATAEETVGGVTAGGATVGGATADTAGAPIRALFLLSA
jgi:hypothetical protein